MISVKINNDTFQLKTEYSEILHFEYCGLIDLTIPPCLDAVYKSKSEQEYKENWDKITDAELRLEIAVFVGDVIKLFSNIPEPIIDCIDYVQRMDLYFNHLQSIVIDYVKGYPNDERYQNNERDSFIFNGITYYLPKSIKVFGKVVKGFGATALQFTEANDLFKIFTEAKEDGLKSFNMLAAVYCTEDKLEEFNLQTISARADDFKELPMDIVFQVFFCIRALLTLQHRIMRILLASKVQEVKMTAVLSLLGWRSFRHGFGYIKWLRLEYLVAKKKLKNYQSILTLNT